MTKTNKCVRICNLKEGDGMAYYFTVSKKKGEYTPLDITKSKYFTKLSRFKGLGLSLQEIDMYTMMFNDEEELRNSLYNEHILDGKYFNSPLSARILRNGKYHKVMYDFLYQKDIEYIGDPRKIINKILNKFIDKDYRFMKQFAKNYVEFHDCAATASEVMMYADNSIIYGNMDKHLLDRDENGDLPLIRMAKLLIYEYYQMPSGKTIYKEEIKYRNLHSVIAFINNYDKKYNLEVNEENNQMNMFDMMPVNGKTKVLKKRKRDKIDGQISLFD